MIRKITQVLAIAICLLGTESMAQNSSRLVARHTIRYDNGWAPFDSVNFVYSNGRGGDYWDLVNSRLKYDTMHGVYYYNNTYIPYSKTIQAFNTQGKLTERLVINFDGTNWVNSKKTTYTLDGNGNPLERTELDWSNNAWVNTSRETRTYDGNNNMLTQKGEFWNGTAWVNSFMYFYTYDGNNNMIANVNTTFNQGSQLFDSTFRHEQYYNSNNKVDSTKSYSWSGSWQITGKTTNVYNGNLVSSWHSYNWVNSSWENGFQGFYFYDQNNLGIGDSTQQWITWQNAWRDFGRSRSAYNSNNLSIMYQYAQWDSASNGYLNNYIDSMDYNSYGQVTWFKRQGWDAVNNVWTGTYGNTDNKYYYEQYTADVKTVEQTPGELMLFPVPTRNNLNINLSWKQPQDFVVAIYDIQGRLLMQWSEKICTSYKGSVPVNHLPSGNYILKVRGKQQSMEQQFVIMN